MKILIILVVLLIFISGCDMNREEVIECNKCCEHYGNATWTGDMQSCACMPDFSDNVFWCDV